MIIGFDYRDIKSESYPPEHVITDRFFTIDDKRL